MFDGIGNIRPTPKSVLKKEIALERSGRGVQKRFIFLDGCAIHVLRVVDFPTGNAIVQTYIDAFYKHVRRYQEVSDVYLIFDR